LTPPPAPLLGVRVCGGEGAPCATVGLDALSAIPDDFRRVLSGELEALPKSNFMAGFTLSALNGDQYALRLPVLVNGAYEALSGLVPIGAQSSIDSDQTRVISGRYGELSPWVIASNIGSSPRAELTITESALRVDPSLISAEITLGVPTGQRAHYTITRSTLGLGATINIPEGATLTLIDSTIYSDDPDLPLFKISGGTLNLENTVIITNGAWVESASGVLNAQEIYIFPRPAGPHSSALNIIRTPPSNASPSDELIINGLYLAPQVERRLLTHRGARVTLNGLIAHGQGALFQTKQPTDPTLNNAQALIVQSADLSASQLIVAEDAETLSAVDLCAQPAVGVGRARVHLSALRFTALGAAPASAPHIAVSAGAALSLSDVELEGAEVAVEGEVRAERLRLVGSQVAVTGGALLLSDVDATLTSGAGAEAPPLLSVSQDAAAQVRRAVARASRLLSMGAPHDTSTGAPPDASSARLCAVSATQPPDLPAGVPLIEQRAHTALSVEGSTLYSTSQIAHTSEGARLEMSGVWGFSSAAVAPGDDAALSAEAGQLSLEAVTLDLAGGPQVGLRVGAQGVRLAGVRVLNIAQVGVIVLEPVDLSSPPSLSISDVRLSAPLPHAPSLSPPYALTPAGLYLNANTLSRAVGWPPLALQSNLPLYVRADGADAGSNTNSNLQALEARGGLLQGVGCSAGVFLVDASGPSLTPYPLSPSP
jgi:hypothetical protein